MKTSAWLQTHAYAWKQRWLTLSVLTLVISIVVWSARREICQDWHWEGHSKGLREWVTMHCIEFLRSITFHYICSSIRGAVQHQHFLRWSMSRLSWQASWLADALLLEGRFLQATLSRSYPWQLLLDSGNSRLAGRASMWSSSCFVQICEWISAQSAVLSNNL